MIVRVVIDTNNEAFEPEPNAETARLLREAARRIEDSHMDSKMKINLLDGNGLKVGSVTARSH